jgi:integrase
VAVETATKVASGKPDVHVLTGNDLLVYRRAMEALCSTGIDLDVAATQYAHAFQLLNGASLTEAVGVYVRQKQSAIQLKLVSEVADEMIKTKQEKGRSFLYLKDLRLRLARIAKAFPRPLAEITAVEIDKYLASLKCAPRTRNNFRLVFGTLLKFGQRRGYVPKDHPGISTIEKSTQPSDEVIVFTPEEMRSLLQNAKPSLIPVIAIAGFAGVRPEEIKRLDWADINLKQRHIEIKSSKAKTRTRRLIPISRNLRAWLMPHFKTSGSVCSHVNLGNQFGKLARRAKIKWKRNALRHGFISYRLAQTRNIAGVSLEAGNSARIIERCYLKCVTSADARRWFNIYPNGD